MHPLLMGRRLEAPSRSSEVVEKHRLSARPCLAGNGRPRGLRIGSTSGYAAIADSPKGSLREHGVFGQELRGSFVAGGDYVPDGVTDLQLVVAPPFC